MGKILLINGSPHEFGCTYTALKELADTLNANDIETELLFLGKRTVHDCSACMACQSTGQCVFEDAVNDLSRHIDEYDGIVAGSPVYYGSASGKLCSFLDRLFLICGNLMSGKLGAAVVSCRRGGATAAFDRLNKYFLMNNMIVVGSQYWNQVHGTVPKEVCRDEEGMQTMRSLGENMTWLLRCIKAGKQAGIHNPEYERVIKTNFIR